MEKGEICNEQFCKKIRYHVAITTIIAVAGVVVSVVGVGVTIKLSNKAEAICEYSFTNDDKEEYLTIDPTSGTLKFNLTQESVDKAEKDTDVKYKVGYKATFQSSYTNKTVELKGNDDSSGYTTLVKQYGVRDYKIQLKRSTNVGKTTGELKLKVT